ncbi:hypothetical protein [Clostridium celatum]|uniref:Bypass of forespore C C-terminal domain-containing protein n=1 Tax=Clostridium celatum DSM 1785 TaxID=545697 RepID=L1QDX8_9CLOT|nr:hypothetical protein [Clostridium celatum]EKY26194.1 hypothetical protein HMPREF0216_02233 [Clostridium celatum DSM 1785]MCE9654333.1 hypothetical protein [Clostridium celatum]MDU3721939.1 hypothetical protein [Clostridium celatum]MDU6295263.1 hypothetical protein [Clostridium celatum]MDY3358961.1 hypothetical protein [Clostridium celatum]
MNNYFDKNSNNLKNNNKKIAKLSVLILVIFLIVGFGTYFVTDKLMNNEYESEEKTVYNNTQALSDEIQIVLMDDGIVTKEQSVLEFKAENSIDSDINEQFIVNFFLAEGYELEELLDSKLVFSKENTMVVVEPNKYYIGEKDGYFAIYKSDSEGKLTIESEDDIYKNSRPISFLQDQEDLKRIKEFKNCFDTKEEAKESLTAYIS